MLKIDNHRNIHNLQREIIYVSKQKEGHKVNVSIEIAPFDHVLDALEVQHKVSNMMGKSGTCQKFCNDVYDAIKTALPSTMVRIDVEVINLDESGGAVYTKFDTHATLTESQ